MEAEKDDEGRVERVGEEIEVLNMKHSPDDGRSSSPSGSLTQIDLAPPTRTSLRVVSLCTPSSSSSQALCGTPLSLDDPIPRSLALVMKALYPLLLAELRRLRLGSGGGSSWTTKGSC